jgi:hypothetical protein
MWQRAANVVRRRPAATIVLLAAAAAVAHLLNDFVYDDVPVVRDNARLHSLPGWRDIVASPWWPPPFVEQLHRPLASLMLAVQWAVGSGNPLPFRIVSVALYIAGAWAVYRLGSRLLTPGAALAAASVFAVHPVHVEAVAQAVNQGDLVVGLAAALMATRYLDRRRAGDVRVRDWAAIAALYATAMLSKESGYVLPGLLIAAELLVAPAAAPGERLRLSLGYVGLALVAAGGIGLRLAVLGDAAFLVEPVASLRGLDLGGRIATMLQVVPQWLRLLAFPARLRADFPPDAFPHPSRLGSAEYAGLALLAGAAVVGWLARRSAPAVTFGLAWCAIGLLPVSNIVPSGIMLAERTLYLPSVGFVLAAGGAAGWLVRRHPAASPRLRAVLGVACVLAVAAGLVKSVNRASLWNTAHFVVVPAAPPPP